MWSVSWSRKVREQSINSRKITHIGIAVKRRAMATVAFPGDTSSGERGGKGDEAGGTSRVSYNIDWQGTLH